MRARLSHARPHKKYVDHEDTKHEKRTLKVMNSYSLAFHVMRDF